MDEHEWSAERFEAHRTHLRAVAYRMLGSLSDADNAVPESWLGRSAAFLLAFSLASRELVDEEVMEAGPKGSASADARLTQRRRLLDGHEEIEP
jgi:hypothetical protein